MLYFAINNAMTKHRFNLELVIAANVIKQRAVLVDALIST